VIAGLVIAAGTLGVSGCGAGFVTQTSGQVASVPGANADGGPDNAIGLRDLQVAYPGTQGYPAGADAPLVIRIFNNGTRTITLRSVSAGAAADSVRLVGGPSPALTPSASPGATPTPLGEASFSVSIPAGSYAFLVPGIGQFLQLSGLKQPLVPGESVLLTFGFDDGSTIHLNVPFAPAPSAAPRAPGEH
jgi:copper(I)-binding protein